MPNRRFTKKDLAKYNGKHGAASFVAYQGKVYDVTRSFLWQAGTHQVIHTAGADLTAELAQAPHGAEMLEKFPVVAELTEE
ncbi:MAG: cytochrome B5 [Chloroflexi bacterium]|nr:cytochrome B5 [Chloroflexota bacterium]